MHANLMGTAGADTDFEVSEAIEALEDAVPGKGFATRGKTRGHASAVNGIARDEFGDAAGVGSDSSTHEREISLLYGAFRELRSESAMGGIGSRDEQNPACVFIQTMYDARAKIAPDLRERLEAMHQAIDKRAFVLSGSRM